MIGSSITWQFSASVVATSSNKRPTQYLGEPRGNDTFAGPRRIAKSALSHPKSDDTGTDTSDAKDDQSACPNGLSTGQRRTTKRAHAVGFDQRIRTQPRHGCKPGQSTRHAV